MIRGRCCADKRQISPPPNPGSKLLLECVSTWFTTDNANIFSSASTCTCTCPSHFRMPCILGVSYCSLVSTLVYGLYRKCCIPGLWIMADWSKGGKKDYTAFDFLPIRIRQVVSPSKVSWTRNIGMEYKCSGVLVFCCRNTKVVRYFAHKSLDASRILYLPQAYPRKVQKVRTYTPGHTVSIIRQNKPNHVQ